jgi:hypothetical protein
MAYSQFLQNMASKHQINIDHVGGEMLVCRRLLEGLNGWLTQDGHERILPSVAFLRKRLLDIRNEIETMHNEGKLIKFLDLNFISSIGDLKVNIQQAYAYAYAAGEAYGDNNYPVASGHIHYCHEHIKKAIADILITRTGNS